MHSRKEKQYGKREKSRWLLHGSLLLFVVGGTLDYTKADRPGTPPPLRRGAAQAWA
jgi:hypothetical protein